MIEKQYTIKKSIYSIVLKITGLSIGFLLTIYVSKIYGASGAGMLGISLTILQLLTIFGKVGTDTLLVRDVAANFNKKYKISIIYLETIKYTIALSFILAILLSIFIEPLSKLLFDSSKYKDSVLFLLLAFLFNVLLNINFSFLKALKRTGQYSFYHYVSIFLFALIILIVLSQYNKRDLDNIVLAITISVMLSFVISSYSIFTKHILFKQKIIKKWHILSFQRMAKIIKHSIPFLIASSLMLIMNWIDTIMISILKSNFYTGIYYVVAKISMIITIPTVALNNILAPKFAFSIKNKEIVKVKEIITWAMKLTIPINLLILITIILSGNKILSIFGEDFNIGYFSLVVLCIGQFFNTFVGIIATLLLMSNNEKVFLKIMILASSVNIILNFFLIPKFDVLGASIASNLSFLLLLLLSVVAYKNIFLKNKNSMTSAQ